MEYVFGASRLNSLVVQPSVPSWLGFVPHTASARFSLPSDLVPHPLPVLVGIWIGMAEVYFAQYWQCQVGLVTTQPSWASWQLPFSYWVHLRMEAVGYYDVRSYNMLIKSWLLWGLQRQPPDTGNNPCFFNIATHSNAEYLHKGKTTHNAKKKDPSCQWC